MSDYHVHIPTAFELSAAAAGPIVVEHGRGRLPYDVYLHCIQLYAILRGGKRQRWFSNTWLYKAIFNKEPHSYKDIARPFLYCTADYMTLCDHVVLSSGDNVLSIVDQLCRCTDETQAVIACIHRLAMRIHDKNQRVTVLSEGLTACPIKPIRDVLLLYGARLDPLHRNYIYHAVSNGMCDVVQSALDNGDVADGNISLLFKYCAKSGDDDMIHLVMKHMNKIQFPIVPYIRYKILVSALVRNQFTFSTVEQFIDNLPSEMRCWGAVRSVEAAQWLCEYQWPDARSVYLAAGNHRLDVVQYLMETACVTVEPDVLIKLVVSNGDYHPDIFLIDYLLCHGADIHAKDKEGHDLLYLLPLYSRYLADKGINMT